jgi:hypothetical protein
MQEILARSVGSCKISAAAARSQIGLGVQWMSKMKFSEQHEPHVLIGSPHPEARWNKSLHLAV